MRAWVRKVGMNTCRGMSDSLTEEVNQCMLKNPTVEAAGLLSADGA